MNVLRSAAVITFTILATGCNQTTMPTRDGGSSLSGVLGSVSSGITKKTNDLTDSITTLGSDLNPFDREARKFKTTLEASDFVQARELLYQDFQKIEEYGRKNRYPNLDEFERYIWEQRFESQYQVLLVALDAEISSSSSDWHSEKLLANKIDRFLVEIDNEFTFRLVNTTHQRKQLLTSGLTARKNKYAELRQSVLDASLAEAVDRVMLPSGYPFDEFSEVDLESSPKYQELVISRLKLSENHLLLKQDSLRYRDVLTQQSKNIVDDLHAKLARSSLTNDGYLSLQELSELTQDVYSPPFGSSGPLDIGSVGFVDLTPEEFRGRDRFEFEISFQDDLQLALIDAKGDFLKGDLSKYDFVFVTQLRDSSVDREFKDASNPGSKFQSGTQQVPNPEYPSAMANYQKAMSEFQSYQIEQATRQQSCYGTGNCIALGMLNGLNEGLRKRNVDNAASKLGQTPQFLTKPVFTPYQYKLSSVEVNKSANVDYFVIDVQRSQLYRNSFDVNDKKRFTIAYNVHDNDPDRGSIIGRNSTDQDVADFETKPFVVGLSSLFDLGSLSEAEKSDFVSPERFLASISSDIATTAGLASASRLSGWSSGTIADQRFDSVVLVRTADSIGTGFYITPELILTAYHVVEGSNIVELQYFDERKSSGRIVDHDLRLDLAIIRAQDVGIPVEIYSGPIRLGETVEAIGHPKGYEFTISRGVVSAVRKKGSIMVGSSAKVEYIQSDTPISPGNSGGPLFMGDRVVGVADWVRVDQASQNLNFSVSYNEVRDYLKRFEGR